MLGKHKLLCSCAFENDDNNCNKPIICTSVRQMNLTILIILGTCV